MVASVDNRLRHPLHGGNHPGLTALARTIGMRTQGGSRNRDRAGETRYEGLTWTMPRELAANRLIPLPEVALLDNNHAKVVALRRDSYRLKTETSAASRPIRPTHPSSRAVTEVRAAARSPPARLH
jgi:hypothetical protein